MIMTTPSDEDGPLTLEAFQAMAQRLRVDRDIWEELFPMVRDLLKFADTLNHLAPELGREIDLAGPEGGKRP